MLCQRWVAKKEKSMMKEKIKNIFLWLFSRTAVFYGVVFLFLFFSVNHGVFQDRLIKGKLNYYYPDFQELSEYVTGHRSTLDFDSFRQYFQLALTYVPSDPGAIMGLAYLSLQEGKIQQAISYLSQSMKTHPALFWNAYNLGVLAYRAQGGALIEQALSACLMMPPQMIIYQMYSSIVYRQILSKVGETYDMSKAIATAQANAKVLLLDYYLKNQNFSKAFDLATTSLSDATMPYQKAFLFFAEQSALPLGKMEEAQEFQQKQQLLKGPAFQGVDEGYLTFRFF